MLGGKLAVLVVIAGYQASAIESTERRTRPVYDINYRQVEAPMMDVPQPTTSINWWPHAAGGAPADNPVNPHPPPPPPPAPAPVPPPASMPHPLISPLPPSNPPSSAPTTAILALTSTSTPSSSSPATDIISITALPPLDPSSVPTPITYPKKKPPSEQAFKLIYLAPVFVVLGILWGSITAWVTYGCLTRRPRVRDEGDELVGGPRYVPAEREDGGGGHVGVGRGDLEGGALLRDEDGMQEAVFEWPDLREKVGMEIGNDNDKGGNPFLVQPQSTPAKPRSTRTKSAHSTATANSDATYVLDTYDEGGKKDVEDVPWESLRHQSIKRGILEQVQREGHRIDALRPVTGSLLRNSGAGTRTGQQKRIAERRPTRHTRTDSDLLVGDVDLPVLLPDRATSQSKESTYTTATNTVTSAGGSRPFNPRVNSMLTVLSGESSITTSTGDKTQWRPGTGFRIVPESPGPSREPTPTPASAPAQPGETYPATSASESTPWWRGHTDTDRYTLQPMRHTSRSNSPINHGAPTPFTTPDRDRTRHAHAHAHASVLPQSPPQITSPLLENRLCFTPAPASPPRTWIGSTRTPGRTPATAPTKAHSRNRNRNRNRNGDRSRAPPPPPFPSPADINSPRPDMLHMYRSKLVKAPPLHPHPPLKLRPEPMPMVASNASSGSGSTVSYTRDAEGRAMRKVEDIVERGWGTRERAL